jgi:large subunit ribosomal protein L29
MKSNEIRELSIEEMQQKVVDLKEEFFNLRFQQEIGQLENSQKLKEAKRAIARVKTICREVELTGKEEKN